MSEDVLRDLELATERLRGRMDAHEEQCRIHRSRRDEQLAAQTLRMDQQSAAINKLNSTAQRIFYIIIGISVVVAVDFLLGQAGIEGLLHITDKLPG